MLNSAKIKLFCNLLFRILVSARASFVKYLHNFRCFNDKQFSFCFEFFVNIRAIHPMNCPCNQCYFSFVICNSILFMQSVITLIICRYPCLDCGEKFTTGKARDTHKRSSCGRPMPPSKRRRTAGPSHQDPEGTTSAVDGLFKIIELSSIPNSPAVTETLHAEAERIADILR